MNRILVVIIACISFNISTAQSSVNDYKYVIIEKQFHFQNEANEYDLNGMVNFLFRKYGFTTIMEGEALPDDLKGNYCLALKSEVKAKGALRTKATIILKNCENNEVFVSAEGVTKEKDFGRAYQIAIREAFKSFEQINYSYVENKDILEKGRGGDQTTDIDKKEIEELKAEIKELKEEKTIEKKIENKEEKKEVKVDIKNDKNIKEIEKEVILEDTEEEMNIKVQQGIHQETTPEILITQAAYPIGFVAKENMKEGRESYKMYTNLAKEPAFIIYKTILNDVYVFEYDGKSGAIIKRENGNWVMEYVEDGIYKLEKVKINFQ